MPKTYTVKEVADILGFSTNSIYTFLKEKRIRGVRIGKGRFRIPEEELSRILHLSKKPVGVPVAASPVTSAETPAISVMGATTDALPQTGDAVFIEPK
ncbi:helix-turn-helix domain-containing protein, partial [Patescibacteria group bacterium]|nr:helix-turn-helix domain-containing protein [Patescibacteria group bacterium]